MRNSSPLAIAFVIWLLSLLFPSPVVATEGGVTVLALSQQDLNADGQPDLAIIDCAFATDFDRVYVFDQGDDMQAANSWQEATDFTNDVWIFDVGADGTAQLIVDFAVDSDRYVAMMYDDLDGDGQVSYHLKGDKVGIEETQDWKLRVEADYPWTQPSLRNLTLSVDSSTQTQPGVSEARGSDGIVDWITEIVDSDEDGINDYSYQRAVSPYQLRDLLRTSIKVQLSDRQPDPYPDTVFWPLLIGKHYYEAYRYFDRPPAIAIDWEAGVIDTYGILGYPIEEGYHIYSRLLSEKQTTNAANFENPMAYYDMANDKDGWPELQVRFNVAIPYDPHFPLSRRGQVNTPNVEVNYSWDQDNDDRWDYKLNVGANYLIDEVVEFPDFSVKSVPYEDIIPWVRNRTWDVAMLVFDSRPSMDSEGMYGKGWMIDRGFNDGAMIEPSGLSSSYLMGFSDQPPARSYQDIQEGMRGEYSFQYFDVPKIYLSSLDRQVHLSAAEAGVWNLGEDHRLRYANLSGDGYLDQWHDERGGSVVQRLNYAAGVYVYSGNSEVRLKQTDLVPSLWETQPPGNYEEWQRLDAQLNDHQTTLEPDDFIGMLDQLPGSEVRVQGAAARDFRITPEGFRFILEVQPNFRASQTDEPLIPLPALPGNYAVGFDGQTWSVQPATPAVLGVSNIEVSTEGGSAQALRWATVEVLLRNDGLTNVRDLPVCITLEDGIGRRIVMTDTVALVPGEGQQRIAWQWAPPAAGPWQVQVAAYCDGSEPTAVGGELLAEAIMEVSETGKPSLPWLISLGERVPETIALFLLATVTMVGAVAAVWVRRSGL